MSTRYECILLRCSPLTNIRACLLTYYAVLTCLLCKAVMDGTGDLLIHEYQNYSNSKGQGQGQSQGRVRGKGGVRRKSKKARPPGRQARTDRAGHWTA